MNDYFMKIVEHVQKTGKAPNITKQWQHDQSILGIPQVGDWQPAPMPCDPIGIPQQLNYG